MGYCWETLVGHSIPFNSTKYWPRECKGLWPGGSVGTPPPSSLPFSTGGGPKTCAAGGQKCGLGLCLCPAKWGPFPCTPFRWRTQQCHNGWHTQHGCPWLAPPAADTQTVTAQEYGGMPRRFEWQTRSLAAYLPRVASLGCCHSWKTHPWTRADRGWPQQHAAWEHDNHHSCSHCHTGATPFPADIVEPPHDTATAINLQLQGALEWLQQASPTASAPTSQHSMPRRSLPLVALGGPASTKET